MAGEKPRYSFCIEPLGGGGWRLLRYAMAGGGLIHSHCTSYPADHRTDPTGEVAYEQALREAEAWRRQSPAPDRRTNEALRHAITRLTVAEFNAGVHLPDDIERELTDALDALLKLLRQQLEA